jgi:ankyrin repeat protein
MRHLWGAALGIALLLTPACTTGYVDASLDEALVRACDQGSAAEVQRLIAAGANVNTRNSKYARRRTPLALAVHRRNLELIELLEKAGAQEW